VKSVNEEVGTFWHLYLGKKLTEGIPW